ncbi:MAG: hypothetical protein ACI4HI_03535 [Lachnospiraceae bacterium]
MEQNTFQQFDVCEAAVDGEATTLFLILDGGAGLKKAQSIICAPLFAEKNDRYHLYVDCPLKEKIYLAALDGVQPVDKSCLKQQAALDRLTDEKAQKIMGQTLQLLMIGK